MCGKDKENRTLEKSPYLLSLQSRAKPNDEEKLAYNLEAKLYCSDSNVHSNTELIRVHGHDLSDKCMISIKGNDFCLSQCVRNASVAHLAS